MDNLSSAPNSPPNSPKNAPWRRSANGIVGGVCAALAKRLNVEAWLVRFVWAMSVLCFGTGLLLYVAFWICLPREDDPQQGLTRMIFGVCARIGRRGDVDVAVARLIALLLLLLSAGAAVVGYVVLWFLLPEKRGEPVLGAETPPAPSGVSAPPQTPLV